MFVMISVLCPELWDLELDQCLFSMVLADLFGMQSFCSCLCLISPCLWWLWASAHQPCESQLCAKYSAGEKRRQRIHLQSTRDANAVFKQSRAITFSQKCKQESSFVKWVSERHRWVCVCVCVVLEGGQGRGKLGYIIGCPLVFICKD